MPSSLGLGALNPLQQFGLLMSILGQSLKGDSQSLLPLVKLQQESALARQQAARAQHVGQLFGGQAPFDMAQFAELVAQQPDLARLFNDDTIRLMQQQGRLPDPGITPQKIAEILQALSGSPGEPSFPIPTEPPGLPSPIPTTITDQPAEIPPAPPSAALTGQGGGQPSPYIIDPTVTVNPKGQIGLSINRKPIQFNASVQQMGTPQGGVNVQHILTNPYSGEVTQRTLGQGVDPEQLRLIKQTVQTRLRLQPGTPAFDQAVGALLALRSMPDSIQAQGLADLDKLYGAQSATGQPSQPGRAVVSGHLTPGSQQPSGSPISTGEMIQRADQRTLANEAAKTSQTERIQREEGRLPASIDMKVSQLKSVQNGINTIEQTFKPEFVGKGFQVFAGSFVKEFTAASGLARQGKYTGELPGMLAGGLREFTGNISPQEVQFRRSITDIADLLLRARSGAQINEAEFGRLSKMAVRLLDEPAVFAGGLARFKQAVQTELSNTLKGITMSPRDLLRESQSNQPSPDGQPSTPPTQPVASGFSPAEQQAAATVKSALQSGNITPQKAIKRLRDAGFSEAEANGLVQRFRGGGR